MTTRKHFYDLPIPRFQLLKGDCLETLKQVPDNSIDSVVCDPPYEINFMNKGWDNSGIAFSTQVWLECYRVLKPGGHLIAFGGTRTIHRITCAIEDSGFDIRDQICWMQFQGFPKSLNISKQLDRMAGAQREVIGSETKARSSTGASALPTLGGDTEYKTWNITKPATPEAPKWEGWGTALKPSYEPAILARKPISEPNIAQNVLKWGTGGINVDACRFANGDDCWVGPQTDESHQWDLKKNGIRDAFAEQPDNTLRVDLTSYKPTGRWPANIYQCPKPPRSQKEAGLEHLMSTPGHQAVGRKPDTAGLNNPRAGAGRTADDIKNIHPTVKPIKLMKWLVRLVTPPGGTVLDPFLGSGTTAAAAIQEGFDVVGCELTEKYWPIIDARTEHAIKQWKQTHSQVTLF